MAEPTPEERQQWKAREDRARKKKAEADRARIEDVQAEKDARQKEQNVANEAKVKVRAERIFLREGGTREAFNKLWPKLYSDLIYNNTLARLSSDDPHGTGKVLGGKIGGL